jgi:membrane associated rhomboid family serine protease
VANRQAYAAPLAKAGLSSDGMGVVKSSVTHAQAPGSEDRLMGIYDREYYRKEGPSFLGSFTEQGKACKWIIGINVILFIAQIASPKVTDWLDLRVGATADINLRDEEIAQHFGIGPQQMRGMDPAEKKEFFNELRQRWEDQAESFSGPGVLQGQVWRLVTYAFLHSTGGMPWHIIFNMLFLWWFGHEMEEMYGPREFTIFYLVSAFLGGVAYFLWSWLRGNYVPCVGASGAVMAVMVLYAFHYPSRIIRLWWFLPIPIWLFVAFYVAQDAFIFTTGMHSTTAVTVHLAGAAFGFGYYKGNWRLAPLWQRVTSFRLPRRKPRVRIFDEEEETPVARRPQAAAPSPTGITTTPTAPPADEHLEAQVDAVLEKVARSGRDSLTEHEKALLVRASEVYKRRQRL